MPWRKNVSRNNALPTWCAILVRLSVIPFPQISIVIVFVASWSVGLPSYLYFIGKFAMNLLLLLLAFFQGTAQLHCADGGFDYYQNHHCTASSSLQCFNPGNGS